jgi:hypothetical protein
MRSGLVWTSAVCLLLAAAQPGAQQPLTKRDADSLEHKLNAIVERSVSADAGARPLRTVLSDREINAYFRFQGAEQLPAGVVDPTITIAEGGRVSGVATVDLDVVRRSRERGWSDPLAYVSGALELRASGWLRGTNGKGTFVLESATLSGVPIPKALLQEIVAYYSKTPDSPAGFQLDQPFDLPKKIRQIDLQRGAAVIVQ